MNSELELGRYEFYPYIEEHETILKELEDAELTYEERENLLENMLKEVLSRKEKK